MQDIRTEQEILNEQDQVNNTDNDNNNNNNNSSINNVQQTTQQELDLTPVQASSETIVETKLNLDTRPDKRGKWTKRELRHVWDGYIKGERFGKRFNVQKLRETLKEKGVTLEQVAPCHRCGKLMFRTQYVGEQPNAKNAWDVFHLNGDFLNNKNYNLEPMHPECMKQLQNK